MSPSLAPDLRDLLALHLLPGLGPRLTAALLQRFGSAGAVLRAGAAQLRDVPHIGPKLSEDLSQAMRSVDVDAELVLIAKHGVHLRRLGTPEYPAALAEIHDPPHLLYVRGTIQPADARAVALVGSRQFTGYGRRAAERLATELARAGYVIVSGLARGIDGIAHRAALQAGGRTLAVMAGGLSRIYPPEHAGLADEVAAAGALVSEAPMKQEPLAGMFPARNRIISGLSRGVVIIEAAEKSGALITAEHAAEQGRTVFAVPGPIDNPSSAGTNALIREGAVLVRGADDVIEELEGVRAPPGPSPARAVSPPPDLDDVQRRLWEFLGEGARHLDEMAQRLGLPVPPLTGALLTMEMKKLVRRLPGNRYERC
ncbi:MAG TPA: DNA-processing protein DprA [Gemmataceae bacterium]|nr:DNA-processing protein DprA [Gemmataceae bacterium]